MADQKFSKVKVNKPISLIVHGGNLLGFSLSKTLIEQGGRVIIIDHYSPASRRYVNDLKKLGEADFIDFNGLENLAKTIGRIDYVFYLLNDSLLSQETFTSKDFLEESNFLNTTLKASEKHNAKVSLITTMTLNQQLSAHILNTNMSTPSPYSSIELQKYCETLAAEYRDKSRLNTRIIRMGTLLGTGIDHITDPIISSIVNESVTKSSITIEGEGLDLHYLINISDAVYGILKLTFESETEGEVVSLSNNHDYTTLSIAYKLLEINPDTAQIKFVPSTQKKQLSLDHYVPAPNAQEYGWVQKENLEQSLIETISTLFPRMGKTIMETPKTQQKEREEKLDYEQKSMSSEKTGLGKILDFIVRPLSLFTKRSSQAYGNFRNSLTPTNLAIYSAVGIVSLLFLYFIFLPVVSVGAGGYLAYSNAKKAYASAQSLDLENSSLYFQKANDYVKNATEGFNQLRWIFNLTGQTEFFNNSSRLLFGAQYASSGAQDMTFALTPLASYIQEFEPALDFQNNIPVTGREYRTYLTELEDNTAAIEKAAYNINLASDLIDSIDPSVFPKFLQQSVVQLKESNDELVEKLEPAYKIAQFLPNLLGVDERSRYLILLQNPQELRSTGGWISSYAVLAVEGGQIRELKVDDVYNADGELKTNGGRYTPSPSMRQALGIDSWYLSLSNWDPDFEAAADAAEFFLKEMDPGTEIDGLITIDTEFMKQLLEKWGGVEVPGETEEITAENLDDKIYDIHTEFTPGSTTKATFLANLANETLKKLLSSDLDEYSNIGEVFLNSLNQKHLLVYLKDKDAYEYFSSKRWAGRLDDSYFSTPVSVDWNWGGNKANAFLERTISVNMDIVNENTINYTYNIAIANNSSTNIYPQGDYENYMRVYLPENAQIQEVRGFLNNDSDIYKDVSRRVVGGWFNVPIRSTKVFEITYTLERESGTSFPITVSGNNISSDLTFFKQPGSTADSFKMDITYPETWAAISNEGLTRGINRLSVQTKLDSDKTYNLVWQFK